MAKTFPSPHDLIRNAFTPQIGVLCSDQAEVACKKNNLSFIEMLHPFCKLGTEIHFRDGSGSSTVIRNFRVNMVDVNFRPPHSVAVQQYLQMAVSQFSDYTRTEPIRAGGYSLVRVPYMTPWYDAWRETFLQMQFATEHEFTKHLLACILVVSSADQNPLGTLNNLVSTLNLMQNGATSQSRLPKWFNKNVLRYYVILHECGAAQVDQLTLEEMFDSLKATYDSANCFLLKINSRAATDVGNAAQQPPDPWMHFLHNRIPSTTTTTLTTCESDIAIDSRPPPPPSTFVNLEAAEEVRELAEIAASEASSGGVLCHPLSPMVAVAATTPIPQNTHGPVPHDHNNVCGGGEFDVTASASRAPMFAGRTTVMHGSCLSTEDVEQVKLLVQEFCTRALLPFLERQTHHLHELVMIKKGVSKTLLTATKRWFSPNKPNTTTTTTNTNITTTTVNAVTYTSESAEISVRKLGDLYFMVGVYSLAYQAYHTAKRDFNTDQAWLHYAAALEMASLSAFMSNEPTKKTFDYMEESIATYLNTCRFAQFATRATILSVECLRARHLHGQAAHQLNRMTSEDSDLRSALLLEQAAYCFLDGASVAVERSDSSGSGSAASCDVVNAASSGNTNTNKCSCLVRKYAFHMVLAGHRYSKAAQRKHSLRCYMQAQEMYRLRGWRFAEDHIHYTIGRLANGGGRLRDAIDAYAFLLTGQSKQSPQQQQIFLRDYLHIYNALLQKGASGKGTTNASEEAAEAVLPLPLIESDSVKVLVGPATPVRSVGKVSAVGVTFAEQDSASTYKWNKLEEMIVQEAQGSLPLPFRPLLTLFTNDTVSHLQNPSAVLGEPIKVALKLHNPLQILLHLMDVYLMWSFRSGSDTITNADHNTEHVEQVERQCSDGFVKTQVVRSLALQANGSHELVLHVTPLVTGELRLRGICYGLLNSIDGDTTTSDHIAADSPVMSGSGSGSIVRGKQLFEVRPTTTTHNNKEHVASDLRAADKRFTINVVPTAPCLQVSFGELASNDLLRNEMQPIVMELRNVGSIPIQRVFLATSAPHLLSSCAIMADVGRPAAAHVDLPTILETTALREREARSNHVIGPLPLNCSQNSDVKPDVNAPQQTSTFDQDDCVDVIAPGQCRSVTLWMRAPDTVGPTTIDLLLYYESVDAHVTPRYRIVRHIWHLVVQDSISLDTTITVSCSATDPEQMAVRVNVTNMNMVHHAVSTEITLLGVSLFARNWTLPDQIVQTDVRKLLAQESVHFILRAGRDFDRGDTVYNGYSEVRFFDKDGQLPHQFNAPFSDFNRKDDCYAINIFEDLAKLRERFEQMGGEGRIVLKWKAFVTDSCGMRRTVFGQTSECLSMLNIPQPFIIAPSSLDLPLNAPPHLRIYKEAAAIADNCFIPGGGSDVVGMVLEDKDKDIPLAVEWTRRQQLHYNLVHAAQVQHDFQCSRMCVIPVDLYVYNVTKIHVTVTLQTGGACTSSDEQCVGGGGGGTHGNLCIPCASAQHYRWIRCGNVVRHLSPLSNAHIRLSVAALATGTYDLGATLHVWATSDTSSLSPAAAAPVPILQASRLRSAVVVHNRATPQPHPHPPYRT